jgi:hypothetical protein
MAFTSPSRLHCWVSTYLSMSWPRHAVLVVLSGVAYPTHVTFRTHVIRGHLTSGHIIQLFDSPESLQETVANFALAGLRDGHGVLLVMRPKHRAAVSAQLAENDCDVETAIADGQLVTLDAKDTLRQLMRRGHIDPTLFDDVVGRAVRALSARGQAVRVYGAMVDLLAEDRDFINAVDLENLWNQLGLEAPFTLLCGYSSAHFGDPRNAKALHQLCHCHSAINDNSDDDLGSWLVQRVVHTN